jgi:hypothetical protein
VRAGAACIRFYSFRGYTWMTSANMGCGEPLCGAAPGGLQGSKPERHPLDVEIQYCRA